MSHTRSRRPTVEDLLRALGYLSIMLWAAIFLMFPSPSATASIAWTTIVLWMTVTMAGSFLAMLGAVFRIDLKLELPGLSLTLIGPVFFFFSQVYYLFVPDLLPHYLSSPQARYALAIYSVVPALTLLPRTYSLWTEVRRMRKTARAVADAYSEAHKTIREG